MLFKSKLISDKKGVNDISILAILLGILLGSSIMIPFVNAAVGTGITTFDADNYAEGTRDESGSVNAITALSVMVTFLKISLFDFYTMIFLLVILTIVRNIWVGGGG